MRTFQLIVLIAFSVGVSCLIVWAVSWIKKNKSDHPQLYASLGLIRFIAWLILNVPDGL